MDRSKIRDFYKNQTIFITGGTGFVGKVIIEKLLRVCEVEKIYILVRPKKGKSTEERFKDIFNFPCFDRLKSQSLDFYRKVFLINGDCEQEFLGLTFEDQETLKRDVSCVIHAAANVKFDQTLKIAACNARSVRDILNLAKEMTKLTSFVYVSTAYSNCIRPFIGEKFYDPPITADELFAILDTTDDEDLEKLTPRLLDNFPNTYIYTKAVAENIVKVESNNLPVAIVRPAIIISTLQDPMPGWIDNFYGVIGIVSAAALGVLRSLHVKIDYPAYLVPCDYVANLVLASAWCASNKKGHDIGEIPIFNLVGSHKNVVTWRKFIYLIEQCAWDFPSEKLVWYYCFKLRENYYWHTICVFFMHTVLAYVVDFFLLISGQTPLAVMNYTRLDKLLSLISYFSTQLWIFGTKNVENLWQIMGDEDRQLFCFDMDAVDHSDYARTSVAGGRVYLLKDPLDTIPQGQKRLRFLRIAHYSILGVCALLALLLLKYVLGK